MNVRLLWTLVTLREVVSTFEIRFVSDSTALRIDARSTLDSLIELFTAIEEILVADSWQDRLDYLEVKLHEFHIRFVAKLSIHRLACTTCVRQLRATEDECLAKSKILLSKSIIAGCRRLYAYIQVKADIDGADVESLQTEARSFISRQGLDHSIEGHTLYSGTYPPPKSAHSQECPQMVLKNADRTLTSL